MSGRRGGKARDGLEIAGLQVSTRLGAFSEERAAPQIVSVDVRLRIDASDAIRTDELRRTVDWAHLAERIRRVAGARPRNLAESLAADICAVALSEERVAAAEVTVSKNGAVLPGASALRATVRRERTRSLPPFPSSGMRAAATFARAQGSLAKAAGSLLHAVSPSRRFRIQPVAPPTGPSRDGPLPGGIPRIVWITNFTDAVTLPVWLNYARNRCMARSFEFRFTDDVGMDAYVRANAPARAVAAWNRLENGAARADFWRVFTLLREGGAYVDMDGTFTRRLERILENRDVVLLWDRRRFSNFFMAAAPGHPLLAEFFDAIVENVEKTEQDAQPPVFYVTGPGALETVLDGKTGLEFSPHLGCCVQGAFTNERFQYADRPGSKWTRNPSFLKPGT